jgi:glycosyltransferase involved in cell wall biosynthesis
LAEALVDKGYRVSVAGVYRSSVLDLENDTFETINGVQVFRFKEEKKYRYGPLNALYVRWKFYNILKKLHKENPFDLIESPGGSGWFPFGVPAKIPFVSRLHGGEVYTAHMTGKRMSKLAKTLERMQLQKSDHIVSVSDFTARTVMKLLGIKKNYEVIYNSVNRRLFDVTNVSGNERKGLIVFVGTIKKEKGVEELIASMRTVFREVPYAKLVLAGKFAHNQETYEKYLLSLVPENDRERIVFLGALDREKALPSLLREAEVCCFPSYAESFSLVPLEAMSMGKAVIFTKSTSGPELIDDGKDGLLCDPKDPDDIAEKITRVMKDEKLRRKLAENGKRKIEEKFTFEKFLNANISMYERVISEKK